MAYRAYWVSGSGEEYGALIGLRIITLPADLSADDIEAALAGDPAFKDRLVVYKEFEARDELAAISARLTRAADDMAAARERRPTQD